MNSINNYAWVEFYSELATKLLEYTNDRQTLIIKLQKVYTTIDMKLPKLEKDNILRDIDPFTIFGLFNKGITKENRIKIIKGIANEFSILAEVPERFDGIPVLNNQKATFYYFIGDREEQDIDNLWNLFEAAQKYADDPSVENKATFIKYYDTCLQQKGIRWNITMGLYWIRPYKFINLDSTNREFILNSENMPNRFIVSLEGLKQVPSGENYLKICESCDSILESGNYQYHNFPELSYLAWQTTSQDYKNTEDIMSDKKVDSVRYWLYSPGTNASKWDEFYRDGIIAIGWGEIGDLNEFSNKDQMKKKMKQCYSEELSYKNSAHATWQFVHQMKPGDIVFAKKGSSKVIGRGVVTSDYQYDSNREDSYNNVRRINWTHNGVWEHPGQAAQKTLTDITPYTDYVVKLNALFEEDIPEDAEEQEISYPPYNDSDFLSDVYMSKENYTILTTLLRHKKNIIIQGAPGVGKTYAAKRLAYSMMGVKDKERVMMVQFHQSYSYEDFIMGFRPSTTGFELKKGPFYNFCKKAEIDSENDYFFIIDEINRGNLSKIFGELFMLIESDKRGVELQLLYSDEKFSVPENVHIIGMMNTADRSLAMLDYALRRRFAFFEFSPAFDTDGFRKHSELKNHSKFNKLIDTVKNLNDVIEADETLGRGFCIGHSYFCTRDDFEIDDMWLHSVVDYEVVPLLSEYWFDDPSKVKEWTLILKGAIK